MQFNLPKKALLVLGCAALGLAAPSCTDLEVQALDSEILINEEGDAVPGDPEEVTSSIVAGMGFLGDQANVYSLFTHVSDEMIPPTRGVDWGDNGVWRTLHAHAWDPTHQFVQGAWNQLNGRIFQTVEVLAGNPSPETRAQAQFFQAFFMWHVLDLYGQVPFREFGQGVDELPRVLSREEAFNLCVENLTAAIPGLPSQGPGSNTRPNKAAAYALLARLHLNRAVYTSANPAGPFEHQAADMQEVVRYADLIADEGYSLASDYFSIWGADESNEQIFVTDQNNGSNRWFMTLHYSQNPSGWNGFTTLADFYNTFDENDPRIGRDAEPDGTQFSGIGLGFLTDQQKADDGSDVIDGRTQRPLDFTAEVPLNGAPTDAGFRVIKYHPARGDDYIILRFGEAMMNKAEAMMRMGNTSGAVEVLNEVRETRGAPSISSIDEAGMLNERGYELYWEGLRRVDQIRFGTFSDAWSEKPASDASRVLFPVPQQALDTNPNLSQNEGY